MVSQGGKVVQSSSVVLRISCLTTLSSMFLYFIWSCPSKVALGSISLLCCCITCSLVFSANTWTLSSAGLLLPFLPDTYTHRCIDNRQAVSTVPLARCHSADDFINTALFQIKCSGELNPCPCCFLSVPALSTELLCWCWSCPRGSTMACPPIDAVLTGRSQRQSPLLISLMLA